MFAGSLVLVRRKLRGQGHIDIGEVFSIGFEKFVPTFVIVFVPIIALLIVETILVIISIHGFFPGWLLVFVIFLAAVGFLGPFWAIALHYILEENMAFMDAGKKALDIIMKNIGMFWLFGLVASIVSAIGGIVCGIGAIVTLPVGIVMYSLMLEELFPKK